MGENEFKNLFSAEEIAELQAAAEDTLAQKPAKKDGIWYVADDASGNTSFYEFVIGGKVVLNVAVDNAHEKEIPFQLPPGATAHSITVWDAKRTSFRNTNGFALRYEHNDGTGVHVDGNTVRAYVLPRATRWIAEFYGV
jgi:hypothetical protein